MKDMFRREAEAKREKLEDEQKSLEENRMIMGGVKKFVRAFQWTSC